jgi:hypothetical protein
MRPTYRSTLVFLCVGVLALSLAWAGEWVHLGQRTVNHRADHDVIKAKGAKGLCSQIKLQVKHRPVEILDLKVFFENGDVFDVKLARKIPAGGHSRAIDLPGKSRNIKKVTFTYRTVGPRKGKAVVHLWAR